VSGVSGARANQGSTEQHRESWEQLVRVHHSYVYRLVRRLGLDHAAADDVTQQVFLTGMQRTCDIVPGSERPFLYGVALRLVSRHRRSVSRRREAGELSLEHPELEREAQDKLVERKHARELLDRILAGLSYDFRVVFVLYEIEELTMDEIARVLELPEGTVASRLRRAREQFRAEVSRLEARFRWKGGGA